MISLTFLPTKTCLLYFVILTLSHACPDYSRIIEEVNNANTTWKAGLNFRPDYLCESIERLSGSRLEPNLPGRPTRLVTYSGAELPDEFDARKRWPNCPTVLDIPDQSHCGSDWAVSTASVFSDRLCIATNGNFTLPMSSEFLMACFDWAEGCLGGGPKFAWNFIESTGIVTGGNFDSKIGCQPYELPSCQHFGTKGTKPPCFTVEVPGYHGVGPVCEKKCTNEEYRTSFEDDFHKVTQVNIYLDNESAQEDIMKNGPIVAGFVMYEDFLFYKSGVYQHVGGKPLAGHAVRVLGWGTEDSTPYWLVANSWNRDWGDQGLFKIKRGSNECEFEQHFSSGSV